MAVGGRCDEAGLCVEGAGLACIGVGVNGEGLGDGSGLACSSADTKDTWWRFC